MGSGTKHAKRQIGCQQEEKDPENPQKTKHKKRTKKIESQLKDQIEFYFSDSNLQKDRFLKQEISKHPEGYVSVKTIADFNRMKQLTNDFTLVIKAIKSSSLLQLNDDESLVKRITPIPEARNVDAETVYVEKLPTHADQGWLKKVFSQFGKVAYVSLPRFKHNGEIKGFAFIEFETPNEADTAVQTFTRDKVKEEKEQGQNEEQLKSKRRKRSQSESDADDKQSNKTERKRRRTISESSADSHDSASRSEALPKKKEACKDLAGSQSKAEATRPDNEGKGTRKRKRGDKAVHWKHEERNQSTDEAACEARRESVEEGRPSKKSRSSESESNAENVEEEQSEKQTKHKKRKRKAKEKKESKLPSLKVISKLEWLRLKEEYKQLQRQSMQELKKQLQECHERESEHSTGEMPHQARHEKTKRDKAKTETEKDSLSELPFTQGVLLHFKIKDTEIQKKDIREKLAVHGPVAYIDLAEGTGEGHVRFHTPDNCAAVFDGLSKDSGLELVKLAGQEERDYWKKINADRVVRFNAKREKKRGTEKVARKADAVQAHQQVTHVRFDDE